MRDNHQTFLKWGLGLGAVAAVYWAAEQLARHSDGNHDSAPGRTARKARWGDYAVTGRTVTIRAPRAKLYAFWRQFSNLPLFMENVESVVERDDGTAHWIFGAPLGQSVEVDTMIVTDRTDEIIAWRSVDGSQIDARGKVIFADAPEGRGTVVTAIVAYDPPFGRIGQMVAKMSGREPALQLRQELKRLKMLIETGEIATADHRNPQ
jgi:uncharacterized membrane protein